MSAHKRPDVAEIGGARVLEDLDRNSVPLVLEDTAVERHAVAGAPDPNEVARSVADLGERDDTVWRALSIRTDKKTGAERALPTLANATAILSADPRLAGRLRRDLFAGEDLWDGERLDGDDTEKSIAAWIERVYGIALPSATVSDAVSAVAARHKFDPAVEWADALPAWDRTERLPKLWTSYFGVAAPNGEEKLVEAYGRCFPVAVMARIYRPGAQVDTVPVLAGLQGLGKSTGLAALCPKPEWFADSPLAIGEKDALQSLAGKLMWELGELASVSRRDVNAVKQFIVSKVDAFRPSYGRRRVDRPRRCVFLGSVNPDSMPEFLNEAGRRWWVMRTTGRVDLAAIKRDHLQLWAEARHRYRAGEPWYLTADGLVQAQDESVRAYVPSDTWEPRILEYLDGWVFTRDENGKETSRKGPSLDATTTGDVLQDALGFDLVKIERKHEIRVGNILAGLGWTRLRAMASGRREYRYHRPTAVKP